MQKNESDYYKCSKMCFTNTIDALKENVLYKM